MPVLFRLENGFENCFISYRFYLPLISENYLEQNQYFKRIECLFKGCEVRCFLKQVLEPTTWSLGEGTSCRVRAGDTFGCLSQLLSTLFLSQGFTGT